MWPIRRLVFPALLLLFPHEDTANTQVDIEVDISKDKEDGSLFDVERNGRSGVQNRPKSLRSQDGGGGSEGGAGAFGKIMVIGGWGADGTRLNTVSLIDLDNKPANNCTLTAYPVAVSSAAGGLVATANGSRPVVCGGYQIGSSKYDKCHLLGFHGWEEVQTLSNETSDMASVPIKPQWMFFTGGYDGSRLNTTFLLNSQLERLSLPDLSTGISGACAVILKDGQTTQVGVLGGYHTNRAERTGYRTALERYQCTKGETPNCTKDTNGPDMNHGRYKFGCGTLQTSQGGRVLLALRSTHRPSEILDLEEGNNWKILSANMDVPKEDRGDSYSFVTSDTDPTTGYFMPKYKEYMYQVTCVNASACKFVKINNEFEIPHQPVTMVIQPESGLKCPGT